MMSWFQSATRNIKIPEKFIDIQNSLRNGKFHGWVDIFDRNYDGSQDLEEYTEDCFDKSESGYLKDVFVDGDSYLSDITEEEYDDDSDSDYVGSDEEEDNEDSEYLETDEDEDEDENEDEDDDSEYLESDQDEGSEYLPSDEEVEVSPKKLIGDFDEEFDDEYEDSEYEPSETDESENSSFNDDYLNIIKKINYYKNKIKGLEKLIQ